MDLSSRNDAPVARIVLLGYCWNGLVKRYVEEELDHDVWYLRQEDVLYNAGTGCSNSVFTRLKSKVFELMDMPGKIVVEDTQLPMELAWKPTPLSEHVDVGSDFAARLSAMSVPIVFVRTEELLKSAARFAIQTHLATAGFRARAIDVNVFTSSTFGSFSKRLRGPLIILTQHEHAHARERLALQELNLNS